MNLPFTKPCMGREEVRAAMLVVKSGWLASGPQTRAFEAAFAAFTGSRHAVACSSGTAALQLALGCVHVPRNSEVVVPSMTFTATAAAVVLAGATVRFADIQSTTEPYLSVEEVARLLTAKCAAVIYVTYGGYPGALSAVERFCHQRNLPLVVDATHAPGVTQAGRGIGAFGRCACFSFHTTKNMTSGEGGALTTNDDDLASEARRLRDHGLARIREMTDDGSDYEVIVPAWNARMGDIPAAIAVEQLRKLPRFNEVRRSLAYMYDREFRLSPLLIPFEKDRDAGVAHLYPVLLPPGIDRRRVRQGMRDAGIETSVHYPALHLQSAYRHVASETQLPNSESYGAKVLTLPLHPGMSKRDVQYVASHLKALIFRE